MAYIDPEGMFGGDRMAKLSDSAKMAWPWFWCAGNTAGRMELSYKNFRTGPFRQFQKPPTEKQFWEWVSEFHNAFLLYVYEANGQAWGHWNVLARYLPKYTTHADRRTPAPPVREFLAWQESYQQSKTNELSAKCTIFNLSAKLTDPEKSFPVLPVGIGNGIGVGVGKGIKHSSAADAAAVSSSDSVIPFPQEVKPPQVTATWIHEQHDLWYARAFWNKKDKEASRRAYAKRVKILVASGMTHQEAVKFLWDQAIADRERFLGTPEWDWRQNMHPATWLNGERWEDQPRARDSPTGPALKNKQQQLADMWSEA